MLISMPTGTSTILGVFQAILALLVNGTNFALPNKLMRKEKFASEIFRRHPAVYVALQKENSPDCAGPASNGSGINGFRLPAIDRDAGAGAPARRACG
jgi:hypothetical protein